MNDRTIIRACRAGASTIQNPLSTRTICGKCQTSHYRRGRRETTCQPVRPSYFTPEEINAFVAEAREQRIAEDIAAYEARKAA